MFRAVINTPGYLPMADDTIEFDTAAEAWSYLADERRDHEENASDDEQYTDTVTQLSDYATTGHGSDVVYGSTPGYDGSHDLGVAYSVVDLTE